MRFLTFLSLIFAFSSTLLAQEDVSQKVDSLIMLDQVPAAHSMLEEALATDAKNYELLWRISRTQTLLGDKVEGDAAKAAYEKALEYANQAIKADKKGSMGYIRRGAANGKLALFQGVLTANTYVIEVRDDAEKAIKLNNASEYEMATAYYILGRTHLKLTETPAVLRMPLDLDWGNLEEALEYLEKATQMRPDFLMYHLEYAKALIEDEREDDAKKVLASIADMPNQEPGDEERKAQAVDMMKGL